MLKLTLKYWIILIFLVSEISGVFEFVSRITEDAVKSYGKKLVEETSYLKSYDFVIVGSGPAGCVLANRLSENVSWKILLIEAGTIETVFQTIPLNAPYNVESRYNWGYSAEKQNYSCKGMTHGRCPYPRGKALGGTSVINGMLYTRGSRGDFDHWKRLGIDGWDYDTEVLPAFKKSEHANLKYFHKPDFHGYDGLLSVTNNPYSTPMADVFAKSMSSLGYNEIDINSNESIGFGRLQATTKFGRRHSAFESFIRPILRRQNLHIMLNTRVTKVLIDPLTKTAFGVEFLRNRQKMKVLANREVILSSGTFHSPQLLILSGIGSSYDLQKLKIPQIVDLPVGKEMHDHFAFGGVIVLTELPNTLAYPLEYKNLVSLSSEWLIGRGLFTIANGAEILGFIKIGNSSTPDDSQPNIELVTLSANPTSDGGFGLKNCEGMSKRLYDSWAKSLENNPNHMMPIGISVLHPKSVGYIEVTSTNIFDAPKLYSNFLKEPEDVETVLDGIRFIQKLIQTEPFKNVGAKIYDRPMTSCETHEFNSDDYWRCAIRIFMVSLHHQVATCKMGSESDKTAVVDSRLRVLGVRNLRVIDTSIIPAATSAHTNALSFMIGERGADFIKNDHL